jgi:hypothetical protein
MNDMSGLNSHVDRAAAARHGECHLKQPFADDIQSNFETAKMLGTRLNRLTHLAKWQAA